MDFSWRRPEVYLLEECTVLWGLLKETLPLSSVSVSGNLSAAWPLVLKETLLLSSALSLLFCFQSSLAFSSLPQSWTHNLYTKSIQASVHKALLSQVQQHMMHWNFVCRIRTWSVFTVCTGRQEYWTSCCSEACTDFSWWRTRALWCKRI